MGCKCTDKRLHDLKMGENGVVLQVEGAPALKKKVLEMGLVPGTSFRVERKGPLNDPISIRFRGFELSLRLDEAQVIKVQKNCAGCVGGCL